MMTASDRLFTTRSTYPMHGILALLLLAAASVANATVPDIRGTYSGTVTADEFDCGNTGPGTSPFLSFSETTNMSVTISTLDTVNGGFSGSGSQVFPDGTDTFNFSGVVDPAGAITGSWISVEPDGHTSSGAFFGNISNGVMTLQAPGQDDPPYTGGGTFCYLDTHGTLTLIVGSGVVVTPVITPSSTITSILDFTSQIQTMTSNLGARLQSVMHGIGRGPRVTANGLMLEGMTGQNAGDGQVNYGAWVSYSYSDFDNDLSSTAYDGDRHSVLGGFDMAPWEGTVLGIAVGYEESDTDTTFNGGNQETDGYTIAPYFGYLFTDIWSVNMSFGYSNIDYDQYRTAPVTGVRVTSAPDADRWFGMFNLNGVKQWGNWVIGGRVGTLWARNEIDGFVESDGTVVGDVRSKLGSWNIGGDVAYSFGEFEPYVGAVYVHDYSLTELSVTGPGPQPSNDRDDVLFTAGLRYFGSNNISGNVDWTRRIGRDDYDEDSLNLSLRIDF